MVIDSVTRRIIEDNISKLHNIKGNKNNHFWVDATFYYNGI